MDGPTFKADLIAGFVDFFEDRDRSERDRVWGATLPYDTTQQLDVVAQFDQHMDVLYQGLTEAGWAVDCPKASMYIWARIPEPYRALGSLEFARQLLDKAKVCVSPGIGFGDQGDEYVRFALIENEARIRQAVRGIRGMFKADGLLMAPTTAAA